MSFQKPKKCKILTMKNWEKKKKDLQVIIKKEKINQNGIKKA